MEQEVLHQESILDRAKSLLNPAKLREHFSASQETIVYMVLYGIAGFIFGYLFKRYSHSLLVFIAGCLFLLLLSYLGFLDLAVDWSKVAEVLGMQPAEVTSSNLLAIVAAWVRSNIAISVTFVLGFFFGMRAA